MPTSSTQTIDLKYTWTEEELDAYKQANLRYMQVHRGWNSGSQSAGYIYYLGPAVLSLVIMWSLGALQQYRQVDFNLFKNFKDYFFVFLLIILMATFISSKIISFITPSEDSAVRDTFDISLGVEYAVSLDKVGFTIESEEIFYRIKWGTESVPIEIWGKYLLIIHNQMGLVIPERATSDSLSEFAAKIEKLIPA